MTTLFKCTSQAKNYAKFRPQYPSRLYEKILSSIESSSSRLALDVGCGTGQATVALASYFDKVLGVDPSEAQLENAVPHPKVSYQVGDATHLPVPDDASISAVTVAQAAHWFDLPVFYQEVDRVLVPGGCLAMWTYSLMTFREDPQLQTMVCDDLYEDLLGPYWDERRRLVERGYRDLVLMEDEFPGKYRGERVGTGLDMKKDFSKDELTGFLRSWSGFVTYCQEHSIEPGSVDDPMEGIRQYLDEHYEENDDIPVSFPVTLVLSIKNLS